MEALLIIFAEIIIACMAPFLAMIGAVFGLIFEAIALFVGSLLGGAAGAGVTRKKAKKPRKSLISRRVLHWGAGILGGTGVLALLASFVLFDPLLRMVLTRAGDKAGIEIRYEESAGSLLRGRVALANLDMQRSSDTGLAFALTANRVEADIDLWSLFGRVPRIEYALVEGLSGSITPPEPSPDKAARDADTPKARRAFRADQVLVTSVALQITPRDSEAYHLEIDRGEVAPFRSQLALFDLLFRSNLSARIADQTLTVSTREVSDSGRETTWDFDRIETDRLKLIVPKAPLTWLDEGTVTVKVADSWDLSDDGINMDWNITLDDVGVSPPEDAGGAERLMAGGLKKLVDAKGGDATFAYQLNLSKEETQALRDGDLTYFWEKVLSGIVPGSIGAPEPGTEAAQDGRIDNAIGKLRGLLKGDSED